MRHLKKRMGGKLEHLKIVTNGHPHRKTTEDEVHIWINSHIPNGKQSKEDWNTSTQLKYNGPSLKVPSVFGFLSWLST